MSKRREPNHDEDDLVREMIRLMPEFPQVMRRVFRRVEKFDGTSPATFLAKMQSDLDGLTIQVESNNGEAATNLYHWLSRAALSKESRRDFAKTVANLKRKTATDARYSMLLRLMGEADERIPYVSSIVAMHHAHPAERLHAQCAPLDLLRQAEQTRGERRATAVLRALGEVAEAVYSDYLITLWQLSFFRKGEMPPAQIPASGVLIKEVQRRLPDYAKLVDPDAMWMRNSAIHNPREYLVGEDALMLWDKNVPRTKVRVDDLFAMVERMYTISAVTIQKVGQLYLLRNLLLDTGVFDLLLDNVPNFLSPDAAKLEAAERELMEKVLPIIQPLQAFFGAHFGTSTEE